MGDVCQRKLGREEFLRLVGCDADVAQFEPMSAFVVRSRTERIQHEHASRLGQPPDSLRVPRAPLCIDGVQATDVEYEIEWVAHAERIESRYIADVKINSESSAFRFLARGCNRLRRKIDAGNLIAVLREVNRVGAGAASQVERAPACFAILDERDNFGRCNAAVPRRLAETILEIEKEFAQHGSKKASVRSP